jgi:hypothetical protein
LVQRLLDSPDIFVRPTETKLKFMTDDGQVVEQFSQYNYIPALTFPGFDKQKYAASLAERTGGTVSLRELIEADIAACLDAAGQTPGKAWVIKEVGGNPRNVIGLWRSMFPEGKILIVERAPQYVARSVFCERRRRGARLTLRQINREIRAPWQFERLARTMAADDSHFVRYETLVANPARTMKSVAGFLGVPFDAAMLAPTMLGYPCVVHTASRNELGIFRSDASFLDGLSLTEQAMMLTAGSAWQLLYTIRNPRRSNAV